MSYKRRPRKYLSAKELVFVDTYIQLSLETDLKNPVEQAAVKAGYSPRYGAYLMNMSRIQDEMEKRRKGMAKKIDVNPEKVIQEIAKIAFGNLGKFIQVDSSGKPYWDFSDATEDDLNLIESLKRKEGKRGKGEDAEDFVEVQIAKNRKLEALDKLMRHLGLYNDQVDVRGELTLVEALQAGRQRVRDRKNG
jgi:phage terminase small subunit